MCARCLAAIASAAPSAFLRQSSTWQWPGLHARHPSSRARTMPPACNPRASGSTVTAPALTPLVPKGPRLFGTKPQAMRPAVQRARARPPFVGIGVPPARTTFHTHTYGFSPERPPFGLFGRLSIPTRMDSSSKAPSGSFGRDFPYTYAWNLWPRPRRAGDRAGAGEPGRPHTALYARARIGYKPD